MPPKKLEYDPTWQSGPPRGALSGRWERMVQFGLHFWILDLAALLLIDYLLVGSLSDFIPIKNWGLAWNVKSPVLVIGLIGISLISAAWLLYRTDRRGPWDDGPGWFRAIDWVWNLIVGIIPWGRTRR